MSVPGWRNYPDMPLEEKEYYRPRRSKRPSFDSDELIEDVSTQRHGIEKKETSLPWANVYPEGTLIRTTAEIVDPLIPDPLPIGSILEIEGVLPGSGSGSNHYKPWIRCRRLQGEEGRKYWNLRSTDFVMISPEERNMKGRYKILIRNKLLSGTEDAKS